jgi:arylsulfatase I/J
MLFSRAALLLVSSIASQTLAAESTKPHILYILLDDYGWADAGWHRPDGYTDVVTPRMNELTTDGVVLDRHYVYQFCSPTRSAVQSGRNPIHVNGINCDPSWSNRDDPVSGYAGIPVNMTGIAQHMKAGGYQTHMAGKWDVGMATEFHTPKARGYDTSLFYYHHANDYFSFRAQGFRDLSNGDGPATSLQNPDHCSELKQQNCVYEDALFFNDVHSKFTSWKEGDAPLFVFWAPHIVHGPLQVPDRYEKKFNFIHVKERRLYHAMVFWIDEHIGNVTDTIKSQGMWDNTLVVMHADNGGPLKAGANNYPLKGGKFGNWEGGIRAAAFASGGFLPKAVRGTKLTGLMAAWDWYTTFAKLAGVDPTDHVAAKAGLPPVDGVDLWPYLSGATKTSPRSAIPIGSYIGSRVTGAVYTGGLISGEYKILLGNIKYAAWTGKEYPNATKVNYHPLFTICGNTTADGCLFNIFEDPSEYNNLASSPAHADIFNKMLTEARSHDASVFNPNRGTRDPAAKHAAKTKYGGYWGPFIEL